VVQALIDFVQMTLVGLFVVSVAVGVIAWLVAAVALVQLPFNAKRNSITGWLRFNPLNVMLYTDKLTARGGAIRRRLFLAVAVFVASILAGWAIFGIIKLVALAL
jgi:hypothetical protein